MSTNSKVRSHEPGSDLVAGLEDIRQHHHTPSLPMNAKFGNPNA